MMTFDLFDISIFLFLTGFAFFLLSLGALLRQSRTETSPKLKRDPLKIKVTRKSGAVSQSQRLNFWFGQMLRRADIRIDRLTALLLIMCVSLLGVATAIVFEFPVTTQPLVGVGMLLAGFGFYYVLMLRRLRKFSQQFPAGLELMARATRAGESLESAFEISTRSSEQPLKNEFKYCQRQLALGLPIETVAQDLAARIGSSDLKLFAHTIAIHRTLGGRLADALERLSAVIRKRSECAEKLKSLTGLGRFAVFAITAMGAFVLIYMLAMEPDYIGRLTESSLGRKLIVYAGVSELVGLIWVALTLKSDL